MSEAATETAPPTPAPKRTLAEEPPVVTHHRLELEGRVLEYTVTTGRLPLRDAKGEVEALLFFMAYTVEGERRPLMFSFNGGPGSPSVWLHLGTVGPKRVRMKDDGHLPPPPYSVEANPHTWIEHTDVVFLDPIGTGFSEALDEATAEKYWSMTGDVESVSEAIRLYLARYDRFSSPLYLVGESYGTTRAAGIVGHLIDRGVAFNGIVLVSSILNFQTVRDWEGNDLPYLLHLPTYAAIAWYHRVTRGRRGTLEATQRRAERFVRGPYATFLMHGDAASERERKAVRSELAALTGLSEAYIALKRERIEIMGFCKELLRSRGLNVGRLDGRITGADGSPAASTPEFDPSMAALLPPYLMAFNDYVRRDLNFRTDKEYLCFSGVKKPWVWDLPKGDPADTGHQLRAALLRNPYMRVFIASGYFDLATPYFATEYTLAHLDLPAHLRPNLETHCYEAGHMMYTHEASLARLKQEVGGFLASTGILRS